MSRLGNPLINEVIIALGDKDRWNTLPPAGDKQFAHYYASPELAGLLPVLYPGVFPNLAALVKSGKARADLEAILLTGIPAGIIPGFQNSTGSLQADMLRLNTAITPAPKPNILGVVGGDLAGFPNGRRVFDDVVTVELRAIAGVTFPAGRQDVHPGQCRKPGHRRPRSIECQRAVPEPLPVPRRPVRRVRQPVMIGLPRAGRRWRGGSPAPG